MFNRINISKIIYAHLKTLRRLDQNKNSESIYWKDTITFFIFPGLLSILLCYLELNVKSQLANLIAIISIFGGFLFNLLAIIYSYTDKINSSNSTPIQKIFVKEINSNISFCILLSIFIVIVLLSYALIPEHNCALIMKYIIHIIEYIIYFLSILFFLTLLMVLSRIFILLEKEGDKK